MDDHELGCHRRRQRRRQSWTDHLVGHRMRRIRLCQAYRWHRQEAFLKSRRRSEVLAKPSTEVMRSRLGLQQLCEAEGVALGQADCDAYERCTFCTGTPSHTAAIARSSPDAPSTMSDGNIRHERRFDRRPSSRSAASVFRCAGRDRPKRHGRTPLGKTTLAIDQMKACAAAKPTRVCCIAPTFQQARDIAWEQLKRDCAQAAISINERNSPPHDTRQRELDCAARLGSD